MLKTGDIVMYIRMLVDNFMDSANQHLIHLEYTSDTKSKIVVFAPEYIKRILHELIANALKYTPRNGKVNVKLITLDDNRLRLVVADTGKGIPLDNINSIYEPFYQSINDDDGVETVVGLALVNQLVKAMNGTIDIDSAPGQGTAFTIEFPVQTATESDVTDGEDISLAETLVQQSSEENHQKPLVFIVENTEDVAYFIASHLKDKYNVRFARDGREAQQNVQDLVPDLIITEQKMPVMDGKELIKRLRKDASLRHIPIIAITASTSSVPTVPTGTTTSAPIAANASTKASFANTADSARTAANIATTTSAQRATTTSAATSSATSAATATKVKSVATSASSASTAAPTTRLLLAATTTSASRATNLPSIGATRTTSASNSASTMQNACTRT